MPFYFWALLIAGLLPYLWVGYAKFSANGYNNRKPRLFEEGLQGAQQRAYWAHLNAFEALPFFIAAVLVAHLRGVEVETLNHIAIAWIVARVLHGLFYVIDQHALRSLAWALAMACNIALFVHAAHTEQMDRVLNIFS